MWSELPWEAALFGSGSWWSGWWLGGGLPYLEGNPVVGLWLVWWVVGCMDLVAKRVGTRRGFDPDCVWCDPFLEGLGAEGVKDFGSVLCHFSRILCLP